MASNFSLLYIPGINDVDTPIFASLEYQRRFFNGKVVVTPIDGFYVPHYRDTIEISMNDLVSNGQYRAINYLAMNYLEKRYYYFVDGIEYISESVARLFIRMDTIQTYMFDVVFIQSHLTRECIKRYNSDGSYNRNYLRENFSAGNFKLDYKKYYRYKYNFSSHASSGTDLETGYLISKVVPDAPPTWYYGAHIGTVNISSSYSISFVPIINSDSTRAYYWYYNVGQADVEILPIQNLNSFNKTNERVMLSYYLPFAPFETNTKVDQDARIRITLPARISYDGVTHMFSIIQNNNPPLVEYYDTIQLSTGLPVAGQDFNINYVPALLDEFYEIYKFGEAEAKATIPLHLVTKPSVDFKYVGDPWSGKRYYYIVPQGYSPTVNVDVPPYSTRDPLGTMTCASNVITIDLMTEGYINYYAYNKASTWAAVGSAALSIASIVAAML